MKLTNPTDDELNAAFAEKVAGWRCFKEQRGEYSMCVSIASNEADPWQHWDVKERAVRQARYTPISCIEAVQVGFFGRGLPRFTQSADAVLPWLNRHKWWGDSCGLSGYDPAYPDFHIHIVETPLADLSNNGCKHEAFERGFARAAVIALLRAHGVEVIFE